MAYIEITEEKHESILEHLHKGIKCLTKVAECFEELKEEHYGERHHERREDEEYDERYGRRRRDDDRYTDYRGGGGRYSRY